MPREELVLIEAEREELESRSRSRSARADDARRARLILLLADGVPYRVVSELLDCNHSYVVRWKQRFLDGRLAGLYSRHRGSKRTTLTPRLEARILEWTRRKPSDGSTHWSTRKLARELGVNHIGGGERLGAGWRQAASARALHGLR